MDLPWLEIGKRIKGSTTVMIDGVVKTPKRRRGLNSFRGA